MVEIWRKEHIDLSNSRRKERSEGGSNTGHFYLMIPLFFQGHSNPEIPGSSAESTNENGNFGRHGGRRRLLRFRGRWRGSGRVQVSVRLLLLIITMDVYIYIYKRFKCMCIIVEQGVLFKFHFNSCFYQRYGSKNCNNFSIKFKRSI